MDRRPVRAWQNTNGRRIARKNLTQQPSLVAAQGKAGHNRSGAACPLDLGHMLNNRSMLEGLGRVMLAALVMAALPSSPCRAEPPGVSAAVAPERNEAPETKPQSRTLRLKHHWTGESLDVVYRIGDAYQPEAMAKINHFLRDWRCNKSMEMDPKLIDRIYDLHQEIGAHRTIRLVSGFRSEGYNASLLLAGRTVDPESQHMFGRAVDIFVPGLPTDKLKDAAEAQALGGVGHYPFSGPRFVHIDTGPPRHWTEMDPAARRRLGLAKRGRTRFKLNCELTMADALREVSPFDAIAALPPGASVNPAGTFHNAVFASRQPATDHTQSTAESGDRVLAGEDVAKLCEGSDPLTPLGLLAGKSEAPQPY
jgi:uncharacterized protein YcbK (DUF882 family)